MWPVSYTHLDVYKRQEEDHENIRKELKEGTLDIRELKRCIYNTVNIILQSNQYEEAVSYENQFDGLGEWLTVK